MSRNESPIRAKVVRIVEDLFGSAAAVQFGNMDHEVWGHFVTVFPDGLLLVWSREGYEAKQVLFGELNKKHLLLGGFGHWSEGIFDITICGQGKISAPITDMENLWLLVAGAPTELKQLRQTLSNTCLVVYPT